MIEQMNGHDQQEMSGKALAFVHANELMLPISRHPCPSQQYETHLLCIRCRPIDPDGGLWAREDRHNVLTPCEELA